MNLIEAGPGRRKRWKTINKVNLNGKEVAVADYNGNMIWYNVFSDETFRIHDNLIKGFKKNLEKDKQWLLADDQIQMNSTVLACAKKEPNSILRLDALANDVFKDSVYVVQRDTIDDVYCFFNVPDMPHVDMARLKIPSNTKPEYDFKETFLDKEITYRATRQSYYLEIFFKRKLKKPREILFIPLDSCHELVPAELQNNEFCIFYKRYDKAKGLVPEEYPHPTIFISIVGSSHFPEKMGQLLKDVIEKYNGGRT